MDDDYYIPNAFFAFRSDMFKSELRNNIAQVVMNSLHIMDRTAMTPWKINIYHIEEFEIHLGEDKHKHLKRLKELYRWNEKTKNNIEMTFLSTGDMGVSRYNAQKLLKEPNTESIIKKVKENELNYIIHGVYDNTDSFTRVNYTDDSKVFNALQNIVSGMVNTKDHHRIIGLHNCFYAYTDKGELRFLFP